MRSAIGVNLFQPNSLKMFKVKPSNSNRPSLHFHLLSKARVCPMSEHGTSLEDLETLVTEYLK